MVRGGYGGWMVGISIGLDLIRRQVIAQGMESVFDLSFSDSSFGI